MLENPHFYEDDIYLIDYSDPSPTTSFGGSGSWVRIIQRLSQQLLVLRYCIARRFALKSALTRISACKLSHRHVGHIILRNYPTLNHLEPCTIIPKISLPAWQNVCRACFSPRAEPGTYYMYALVAPRTLLIYLCAKQQQHPLYPFYPSPPLFARFPGLKAPPPQVYLLRDIYEYFIINIFHEVK